MITIRLRNLEFHAFHGLYDEEKILGNSFYVNLTVHYSRQGKETDTLADTINYEELFTIIREKMKEPHELLENLVTGIGVQIRTRYTQIQYLNIEITKKNPPVEGWRGDVQVGYEWNGLKIS